MFTAAQRATIKAALPAVTAHISKHGEIGDDTLQALVGPGVDLHGWLEEKASRRMKVGKPTHDRVLNRRRAVVVSHPAVIARYMAMEGYKVADSAGKGDGGEEEEEEEEEDLPSGATSAGGAGAVAAAGTGGGAGGAGASGAAAAVAASKPLTQGTSAPAPAAATMGGGGGGGGGGGKNIGKMVHTTTINPFSALFPRYTKEQQLQQIKRRREEENHLMSLLLAGPSTM
jgi:hypothetical protein